MGRPWSVAMSVASDSLCFFLPFVVFWEIFLLFDHLTFVCMLVIEAFQSSITFTSLNSLSYEIPRELGGAALDHRRLQLEKPHLGLILEWSRSLKSATCWVNSSRLVSEIMCTVATCKDLLSYYIFHAFHSRRRFYTMESYSLKWEKQKMFITSQMFNVVVMLISFVFSVLKQMIWLYK